MDQIMDTILTTMESRKATRAYDSRFKLDTRTIEKLLKLGQAAPSSFNIQHCRFVMVEDDNLRRKIRDVAMDQAQVTDASLLVIVCAKIDAWKENITQKWTHVDEQVQGFIRKSIDGFYQDNTEMQRDEAIRSSGMASQNLMLAAEGMGLQSGPMIGFDSERVAELIQLPGNYIISNFVVIGKGIEAHSPKSSRLPLNEITVKNTF